MLSIYLGIIISHYKVPYESRNSITCHKGFVAVAPCIWQKSLIDLGKYSRPIGGSLMIYRGYSSIYRRYNLLFFFFFFGRLSYLANG